MIRTYVYCSNLVYEDGELSYILTPAGRALPGAEPREYAMEYFLADHLGNIRVVFGDADRDNVAEVIQENHYYPFGMTMGGLNFNAGLENRYLYQGKEITGDLNLWWHDFHARRFDSQLGRWHVPDPAGQWVNPYLGMGNNPIMIIDPDGMKGWKVWEAIAGFFSNLFGGKGRRNNTCVSASYGSEVYGEPYSGGLTTGMDASNVPASRGGGGGPGDRGIFTINGRGIESPSFGGGDGSGGPLAENPSGGSGLGGDRDGPFRMQPITKPRVDERKIYRDAIKQIYRNDAFGEGGTWDPVTNQRISQLDPRLQRPATDFINAAQAQGVSLRITQGFRFIADQDALYNQGRATPGKIVTNARGGQSYHNYGLAFDVVIMQNGQPVWDRIPSNIGALGGSFGFEWGGNWRTFPDYPHFQMTFEQSILDLQKR